MSKIIRKSILSKSVASTAPSDKSDNEKVEEVEITAQITVPPDGGWGWVVVLSSFVVGFANDGIMFTFGALLPDIAMDLKITDSLTALINSTAVASYYCTGPVVSALINRFGFRMCSMVGAVTSSVSYFITYLCGDYTALIIFYGLIAGFGSALSNMSAMLIIGFYFQKWRSIAFSVAITGCSVGIMVGAQLYSFVTRKAGWPTTVLLQSSLQSCIYFISMNFRPLLSVTVVQTTEVKTPTPVEEPPTISRSPTKSFAHIASRLAINESKITPTQKLFDAVSNINFPTAADLLNESVINELDLEDALPGPSATNKSKLTLVPTSRTKSFTYKELQQLKSMLAVSQANIVDKSKAEDTDQSSKIIDIVLAEDTEELAETKSGILNTVFKWEEHDEEARPLYRDDAFYEHSIKHLPHVKKEEIENPLEYQLKVSRAAATSDLKERKGIFTTAFRRVLATMLDTALLRRRSFLFICLSMFFLYVGYLIPMVFIAHRGKALGIKKEHYSLFLSTIGLSSIVGRFSLGVLALKISPVNISISANSLAGLGTIMSSYGNTAELQFFYCFIYGFTTSGGATIRSLILLRLYGLENLTNCTGIVVMFQGMGCLISTPLGAVLRDYFGYKAAFIFSGVFLTIGGLFIIPVASMAKKEKAPSQS